MSDAQAADEAAQLAEPFEGFSARPYLDTLAKPPVWTIGFGSTRLADGSPVTAETAPITRQKATALMAGEMRAALVAISRDVDQPLSVDQHAALADFIYNVGVGNFEASTLLRKLRAGDYTGAAAEFARWDQAGGRVLAGLMRRRAAETALFLTPDQATGVDLGMGVVSAATLEPGQLA